MNDLVPHIRVVAAVIEQQGRYLITQRRSTAVLAGLWEFPSGKVETGETERKGASVASGCGGEGAGPEVPEGGSERGGADEGPKGKKTGATKLLPTSAVVRRSGGRIPVHE